MVPDDGPKYVLKGISSHAISTHIPAIGWMVSFNNTVTTAFS
jgi:hypothetical protein